MDISAPNAPSLPPRTAIPFAVTMVGAFLSTVVVFAAVVFLLNRPEFWHPMLAAAVIGALATGASIVPIIRCLGRTMHDLVPAFIASSALRMLLTLGGLLIAIRGGHYPAMPTGLLIMPFYFTALLAECVFLIRLMRSVRQPAKGN